MNENEFNYEMKYNILQEEEKKMLLKGYKSANLMGYCALIGIALTLSLFILTFNSAVYMNYPKAYFFPIISSIIITAIISVILIIFAGINKYKVRKLINKSNLSFAKNNMINTYSHNFQTQEEKINFAEDNLSRARGMCSAFQVTSSKIDDVMAGARNGGYFFSIRR